MRLHIAVALASLLGVSVGHAQGIQRSSDQPGFFQPSGAQYGVGGGPFVPAGRLYVACWADAPASASTYFSATFQSHAPWKSRKEFRELVATRFGSVSEARCAGNTSFEKLEERVQQWKDDARAASSEIVDTGWEP